MSEDHSLRELARAVGLKAEWEDAHGKPQSVSPETLRAVLGALGMPAGTSAELRDSIAAQRMARKSSPPPLVTTQVGASLRLDIPPGPYRITAEDGTTGEGRAEAAPGGAKIIAPALHGYYMLEAGSRQLTLAVAPETTHRIRDACPDGRAWGLAVQLYSLRRAGDGGIGDYAALARLAEDAAGLGADAIALSPVHAQFAADLTRFSPYSPSSRVQLDVRHADAGDLAALVAGTMDAGLAEEMARLEALPLVDWPAAAQARLTLLRRLHEAFGHAAPQAAHDDFAAFRAAGGLALERHARFEALHAAQFAADPALWHWRTWPAALRDPDGVEVSDFAEAHAGEVEFHAFLQWLADRGLGAAQAAARQGGARIGLIADLAVGVDPGGSDAWSRQTEILGGVEVGAPPDIFNTRGQGWGITTFSPQGLIGAGFAGFRAMLAAGFRNAGGLRLDHVLGLRRLWLVPQGASPAEGCYLSYPFEDLLQLVKLESARHKAVVIGEDLGTVPEGFRPKLVRAGVAGMRVMWFERSGKGFRDPSRWTQDAVSMTSTHDLPTVAGWWSERDIAWRDKLGIQSPDTAETRQADRAQLWRAFRAAGVAQGPAPAADDAAPVADAAVAYVGRARCDLALVPLEDALAAPEQPNLPGTVDQHPNWRRRLDPPVERMLSDPTIEQRLRGLARARRAP
jgi:4-alpha-glucanotransferase